MRTASLAGLLGLLIAGASAAAPTTERDFGFQPLEIYDFDTGTSRLTIEDMNNDGLDDILLVNNHISRLEILLRKADSQAVDGLPELDDCFENRGILVDQGIQTLRAADLNGDGRKDIITFGASLGLQIRYQSEDGFFKEAEQIFLKDTEEVTTFQIGDLNGNGKQDIMICRNNQADLLWNDSEKPFQTKKTILFSLDKSSYGELFDINNDGITDLTFYFNTLRNPLRVRYGKGDGLFETEQPIDIPPRQYAAVIQRGDAPPQIGMILRNRLAVRAYGFVEKQQPRLLDAKEISPARIGLEGTDKKAAPAWVATDVNNDGFDDLIIAAPELSRLHLYYGSATGLSPEPERIDTLSDVSHISKLAGGDLLVISQKEKIAAIHSAIDLHRFPEIITAAPGEVLTGCSLPSEAACWLVCKNDKKEHVLTRIDLTTNEATTEPLDIKNDPNDLLAFRLPNHQTGLLLFMPYSSPKMFLSDGETLTELSSESFRALTLPLIRSNVRLDQPGDGSGLTVAHGAIARHFTWKDGQYKVTRQFNPENASSQLVASAGYSLIDGSTGTLFFDRNANDLIRFDHAGTDWGKIHIPDADQTIFNLVQLKNIARDTVVLIDRTGLNEIRSNGTRLAPVSEAEYLSPAETPMLSYLRAVQLGSPPRPMIALVDPANRSIELVSQSGETLKSELIFEVYLSSDFIDRSQNRGTEPHDLQSGDLNGDGIGDLVVLCQDKLLIYLGE
jgi:hypothetical protein